MLAPASPDALEPRPEYSTGWGEGAFCLVVEAGEGVDVSSCCRAPTTSRSSALEAWALGPPEEEEEDDEEEEEETDEEMEDEKEEDAEEDCTRERGEGASVG